MQVHIADTDAALTRCFDVMVELRPHLDRDAFLARVARQRARAGYQIAFVADDGVVRTVAGFRISEALAWGRFLYVDDLVTRATDHGQGYGKILIEWLVGYARANDCDAFHLDSGVQREGAHAFYKARGMTISSYHFSMPLKPR